MTIRHYSFDSAVLGKDRMYAVVLWGKKTIKKFKATMNSAF